MTSQTNHCFSFIFRVVSQQYQLIRSETLLNVIKKLRNEDIID